MTRDPPAHAPPPVQHASGPTMMVVTILVLGGAVLGFVYTDTTPSPEVGQVLARIDVARMDAGDATELPFFVNDRFERLGVSYRIEDAAHLRIQMTDPDGMRYRSQAIAGTLDVQALEPKMGPWKLRLEALDEAGLHGHVRNATFAVLGFGGSIQPATT